MGIKTSSQFTTDKPISITRAREVIADNLGVATSQVYVDQVHAHVLEGRDGTGQLTAYMTEWEFTAEIEL